MLHWMLDQMVRTTMVKHHTLTSFMKPAILPKASLSTKQTCLMFTSKTCMQHEAPVCPLCRQQTRRACEVLTRGDLSRLYGKRQVLQESCSSMCMEVWVTVVVEQSNPASQLQWVKLAFVPVSTLHHVLPFLATDNSRAAAVMPRLTLDAPSTSPMK